jgi:HD-GYP domain-containing protein (c-di-GMP phosphodiesterase class II)
MFSTCGADRSGMGFKAIAGLAVARSSTLVISVAFLVALMSIFGVTALQQRANSSRDAQVDLSHVERDFDSLQSVPYDVIGAKGPTAQAAVLKRMVDRESRIETTLAGLRGDALTPHLNTLVAPYKANTAVLRRILELLIQGRQDRADALGVVAGGLQIRVDRELELASLNYEGRAASSLRLAMYGSAAMILALVSLFGLFYFLSRRAHAIAERLLRDNAKLLLDDSQLQVIQRLAVAAEYRDDDTGQHTRRVGRLSARIGAALGMPAEQLLLLGQAAALHDVGKIGIPDGILLKPGRLTPEEFERMKAHTTVGAGILAGRNFPLLEMAEEIALSHHERWDGSGYPAGTSGTSIPLVGRIVAVADVFDALTHARPYKEAWSVAEALTEIRRQRSAQFDPEVVDAFLRVLPGVIADADAEPGAVAMVPVALALAA